LSGGKRAKRAPVASLKSDTLACIFMFWYPSIKTLAFMPTFNFSNCVSLKLAVIQNCSLFITLNKV
jgi:hypothetical protein